MARILRTDLANADLVDVLDSLTQASPSTAVRFEALFEQKADLHLRFPFLGAPCDELSTGLRTFTIW